MARSCKRVVVCGKARRICFEGGRIVSNKPWGKSKKRTAKRRTSTRSTKRRSTKRTAKVGRTVWVKRYVKGQGCRLITFNAKGKIIRNTKSTGCKRGAPIYKKA